MATDDADQASRTDSIILYNLTIKAYKTLTGNEKWRLAQHRHQPESDRYESEYSRLKKDT